MNLSGLIIKKLIKSYYVLAKNVGLQDMKTITNVLLLIYLGISLDYILL